MTSSEERASAEAESSRLPHREVADGLLRLPLEEEGETKQTISVLEQILGWKGGCFSCGFQTHWPATYARARSTFGGTVTSVRKRGAELASVSW